MKVKIALGSSVYRSSITTKEITVKQLYKRLETPNIQKEKDGKYFIFADFGESTRRTADTIEKYYGATLDLDDVTLTLEDIKKAFKRYSYCIYTTFNHKVKGKGKRYRIVIPYKFPISGEEHRSVATFLLYKIGAENIGSDAVSQKALSRPMYLPSCTSKREKLFEYEVNDQTRYFDPTKARLTPEQEFELDNAEPEKEQFNINEEYTEGGRNDALARLIGKFIKNGMDLELILQSAQTWNTTNCSPPLSKKDVKTITKSVFNSHKRNSKDTGWGYDEVKRRIDGTANSEDRFEDLLKLVAGSSSKLKGSEKERLIKKVQQKTKLPLKIVRTELKELEEDHKDRVLEEEDEKEELSIPNLKKEFINWVYLKCDDKLYNTENGLIYKNEGFNRSYSNKIEKGSLLALLLKYRAIGQADMLMFDPEKEVLFNQDHIIYVNTYIPPEVFPVPGDVTPMLNHFDYILEKEDECDLILDYIAFLVQNTGVKIRWMPIIKGMKGTGKSIIAEQIIAPLLGRRNMFSVDTKRIKSDFNSWQLDTQLVVFHELKIGETRKEKLSLTDSLKEFITDPYITAHRKGIDEYQAVNKANVMGFTNHEDAIMMTRDERRFGMFRSEAKPKGLKYYNKLIKWCSSHAEEMLDFFLERDISKFNYSTAPETDMTIEVKEGSLMWPHSLLTEALNNDYHYFSEHGYCTYTGIVEYLKHNSTGKDLLTLQNIESSGSSQSFILINALKELGFRKWINHKTRNDRMSIKGVQERIWVSPKVRHSRFLPIASIKKMIIRHEKTIFDFED